MSILNFTLKPQFVLGIIFSTLLFFTSTQSAFADMKCEVDINPDSGTSDINFSIGFYCYDEINPNLKLPYDGKLDILYKDSAGNLLGTQNLNTDSFGITTSTIPKFSITSTPTTINLTIPYGTSTFYIIGDSSFIITSPSDFSCGDKVADSGDDPCPEECGRQSCGYWGSFCIGGSSPLECDDVAPSTSCGDLVSGDGPDLCPDTCKRATCTCGSYCIGNGFGDCSQEPYNDESCLPTEFNPIPWNFCGQAGSYSDKCTNCFDKNGIWTAIGCITYDQLGIVKALTKLVTSIAGGISLLFILYGAFTVTTSQGNPEKLQRGREIITSAIIGIIFILFSVIILRIIGVEILQLPNFGQP